MEVAAHRSNRCGDRQSRRARAPASFRLIR
jgi:hypothetical protein